MGIFGTRVEGIIGKVAEGELLTDLVTEVQDALYETHGLQAKKLEMDMEVKVGEAAAKRDAAETEMYRGMAKGYREIWLNIVFDGETPVSMEAMQMADKYWRDKIMENMKDTIMR